MRSFKQIVRESSYLITSDGRALDVWIADGTVFLGGGEVDESEVIMVIDDMDDEESSITIWYDGEAYIPVVEVKAF